MLKYPFLLHLIKHFAEREYLKEFFNVNKEVIAINHGAVTSFCIKERKMRINYFGFADFFETHCMIDKLC